MAEATGWVAGELVDLAGGWVIVHLSSAAA
jgi:hypothetical protein